MSQAPHVRRCPHLSARKTHRTTHGVAHQTSLRSRRTMMTHTNSRTREAGRLFILPVTDALDHISTQASPHAGLTAPSRALARGGRTPGSRSDRGGKSRAECQASAPRRRGLSRVLSAGVCVDRSGPSRHRAAPHEWRLHTRATATSDCPCLVSLPRRCRAPLEYSLGIIPM